MTALGDAAYMGDGAYLTVDLANGSATIRTMGPIAGSYSAPLSEMMIILDHSRGVVDLGAITITRTDAEAFAKFLHRGFYSGPRLEQVPEAQDPPQGAERLLLFLLPHKKGQALIGDLREEFADFVLPEYGLRTAKLWFWSQALRSIGRYAVVGFLVDAFHKWFLQGS
jgi:hypothetical protein